MAVIKKKPSEKLPSVRDEFERMLDEMEEWPRRFFPWTGTWPRRHMLARAMRFPSVDVIDKKDKIIVKVEVPGVEKEDIDISVTEDTLNIKGETKKEKEVKEEDYYCCERSYGSFSRSVDLPVKVQTDKIKANLKDGVLEVELPKVESEKPKEIKIEVK